MICTEMKNKFGDYLIYLLNSLNLKNTDARGKLPLSYPTWSKFSLDLALLIALLRVVALLSWNCRFEGNRKQLLLVILCGLGCGGHIHNLYLSSEVSPKHKSDCWMWSTSLWVLKFQNWISLLVCLCSFLATTTSSSSSTNCRIWNHVQPSINPNKDAFVKATFWQISSSVTEEHPCSSNFCTSKALGTLESSVIVQGTSRHDGKGLRCLVFRDS